MINYLPKINRKGTKMLVKDLKVVRSCTENSFFDVDRIHQMCIKRNLYTRGNCEDYSRMLDFARDADVTTENLIKIAEDIAEHSNLQAYSFSCSYCECVENFIYVLTNECVWRDYVIEWL